MNSLLKRKLKMIVCTFLLLSVSSASAQQAEEIFRKIKEGPEGLWKREAIHFAFGALFGFMGYKGFHAKQKQWYHYIFIGSAIAGGGYIIWKEFI